MVIAKYYLLLWLPLTGFITHAQTNSSAPGIEMGTIVYGNSIKEKDYIRKLSSGTSHFSGSLTTSYYGLNLERTFFNDRLGIIAGARYSNSISSVGLTGFFHRHFDYFYLRISEEGTTTTYLKTQQLKQVSHYLGIPLEVRYLLFNSRFTGLYFKVGSVFDFLVKSKNEVDLAVTTSSFDLENTAANKLGTPDNFCPSLYGGIGLRLGRGAPLFNIEITLPSVQLNSNYSTLINPHAGGGLRLMFQIPLKTKK
ncbi:MAG: hypothetical protein DI538_01040 [Azospira oryzae]|jgi:hypothetical protein|nr:MAG: hypothetical protein DI538_01040 [Azospira oryzae]